MSGESSGVPTPLPYPPKHKRHKVNVKDKTKVKYTPKPANPPMAQTTINNYTTFEFKDKDRFAGKDFEMVCSHQSYPSRQGTVGLRFRPDSKSLFQ